MGVADSSSKSKSNSESEGRKFTPPIDQLEQFFFIADRSLHDQLFVWMHVA